MTFKKFIAASTLTVAVASIGTVPAFAEESVNTEKNDLIYDINKDLTSEEIHNRFEQINSTYGLNEPFSDEDTEFIKNYAHKAEQQNQAVDQAVDQPSQSVDQPSQSVGIQPLGTGFFSSSYTDSFEKTTGGGKISFGGNVTSNINLLNHSYGGRVYATFSTGADVSKAQLYITNVAYGAVGGGGSKVGVVYDNSIDATKTKDFNKSFVLDEMKEYGAIGVVYTYTNAKLRITKKDGSTYTTTAF